MDTIVAGEGKLDKIGGCDRQVEQDEAVERLLEVSSWIMILGTVRLICAFGGYAGAFLDSVGSAGPSLRALSRYLQDNPPVVVAGSSWPLLLGLVLRRTRNRGLLLAAALTFFILSFGGALGVVARLLMRSHPTIVFGAFEVSRWGLGHTNPASVVQALMGSLELALEFATAVAAWTLAHRSARLASAGPAAEPRRRLHGRLAVYVSLAFLVLNVRVPFWSVYEEMLNRSTLVREFVLKNDSRPYTAFRGKFSTSARPDQDMELEIRLTNASRLAAGNQVLQAKVAYLELVKRAEAMLLDEGQSKSQVAQALNNVAWMLVTCSDLDQRQPQEALTYAKRAVKLAGEEGNYWNTLGVVWFRLEDWTSALQAFEKSMKFRGGGKGDSYDWFFLAMIEAKMGRKEQARQWYDRAVSWAHQGDRNSPELFQFQVEAAEALGLERPGQPDFMKGPRRAGLRVPRP